MSAAEEALAEVRARIEKRFADALERERKADRMLAQAVAERERLGECLDDLRGVEQAWADV